MDHKGARAYFFEHLPNVRNTSDLLRLTYWVLPHLKGDPTYALGRMDTLVLHLQLEHSRYDGSVRVWYKANRNIATQLDALRPMYSRGSSGPHFCSGLSAKMVLPNGPNVQGPGLPLGVFASEHQAVKVRLDAAPTVAAWWTVFLENTPLWIRTAYRWESPTSEQRDILERAAESMVGYVNKLTDLTTMRYDHQTDALTVGCGQLYDKGVYVDLERQLNTDSYWNALVAGQRWLAIRDIKEHALEFDGLRDQMPFFRQSVHRLCRLMCELNDWSSMDHHQIIRAIAQVQKNSAEELVLPALEGAH